MMPCEICGETKEPMDMHTDHLCKNCWVMNDDVKSSIWAINATKGRKIHAEMRETYLKIGKKIDAAIDHLMEVKELLKGNGGWGYTK